MNEEITSRLVWLGTSSSYPEAAVGNTLSKLPEDVREWALEKLVWFCPPNCDGQAASIWLDPVTMKRCATHQEEPKTATRMTMRRMHSLISG